MIEKKSCLFKLIYKLRKIRSSNGFGNFRKTCLSGFNQVLHSKLFIVNLKKNDYENTEIFV